MHSPPSAHLVVALIFAIAGLAPAQDSAVKIETTTDRVIISLGDQPFTELLFGEQRSKPVLYPIYGPGQVPMTRDFPFKKTTEGEKHDHPHHESLWFTHGDINGTSFWHIGDDAGTIRQTAIKTNEDTVSTSDDWLDASGKRVCSDTRTIKFSTLKGGARVIDFSVTIHATDGDVTFGDTKEGAMGIRTHHLLRTDRGANASNSAGDKGKSLWGKAAKWVNYQSEIGGRPVGVAMFDHPTNPRHPTTWHARDYGLVAANPFGAHDFTKAKKGTGDLTIKSGEKITFRYGIVFHHGSAEKLSIDEIYAGWSK